MSKALMLTPGVTDTSAPVPVKVGVAVGVPVIRKVLPGLGLDTGPKLRVSDSEPWVVPVALIVVVTAEVTVAPTP